MDVILTLLACPFPDVAGALPGELFSALSDADCCCALQGRAGREFTSAFVRLADLFCCFARTQYIRIKRGDDVCGLSFEEAIPI